MEDTMQRVFKEAKDRLRSDEVHALVLAAREVLAAHSTGRFDPLQAACEALDNALDPFEEVE